MIGLGTFGELPFGDPNNAQIHNIEFAETGFGMTFSLGTEVAFGEAFQVLVSLSSGSPNIILWSAVDDSQTASWTDVSTGSTD